MVKFVTTMEIIQLAVIFSVLFSVNGNEVDVAGGDAVNVRPQEGADLTCLTSGVQIKYCNFASPSGKNYLVDKSTVYDDRISFLGDDEARDCGIKISKVLEADNGVWKCEITAIVDGQARTGSNEVTLNVLKAPSSVKLNDQDTGSMSIVYKTEPEKKIRCTAIGGQPAPTFSWTLAGQPTTLNIVDANQESDGDVVTSYQEVSYTPRPEDNGKALTCIANSQAYTEDDKAAGKNVATTTLDIQYAPTSQKTEYDFYGLTVGDKYQIRIKFSMNPGPLDMSWKMADGTNVPQGSESEDGKYSADKANFDSETNQYTALLTINTVSAEDLEPMKVNSLNVENQHGQVDINFKLAPGEKPPVEAGTGPVIAVIIIILVIIVVVAVFVVARSQGLLCFAAGDGMTDAEKGQFKALGAEEDNSTPEKDTVKDVVKNEPEPTKAPENDTTEEKKSNGAQSPAK